MSTDVQTCYRHPDSRAGVRCQRCERPICPKCMNQASVGFHCPECTRSGRQKVYTAGNLATRARPYVSMAIIAVNVAVFLWDLTSPVEPRTGFHDVTLRGLLFGPAVADGEWYRVFTSGFLHDTGNPLHLGFNMFLLYQLGTLLEPAVSRLSYATTYFTAMAGGSFAVLIFSPNDATLGASGAVFGLMGVAFVGLRSRGIDPFATGIGPLIVLNLILTFAIPNISIGGHVGGLVTGGICGYVMFEVGPRLARNGQSRKSAELVATGMCAALGLVLFAASLYIASNPV